ncbi:cyclase family protein [Marinilabiliaceae bacterium JC017]|nr:cyclase family protein [Marinilabiliaceae bacterium JC017]
MATIIDLSHTLDNNTPVFPDDTSIELKQDAFLEKDGYTNFTLKTGMHIGTHLDGPWHISNNTITIDRVPLDQFCGKAIKVATGVNTPVITTDLLPQTLPAGTEILLFHTGHQDKWQTDVYFEDFPVFSTEVVEYLLKHQIKIIGLDTPSPDKSPYAIHKALLEGDILIVENLTNLHLLPANKQFDFSAFPLKVSADSSPVRAVARIE